MKGIMIKPRPVLLSAEGLLLLAAAVATASRNASILCLASSTALYYIGMTGLARRKLGRWAVRRFTVAYLLRALSWGLMMASAYYTYSAVVENILPFGPREFVITSVLALVGAGINYLAVGIRNSVLWKIEGLKPALWFSRLNSIVVLLMAAIPFIPLSKAEGLKWLLALLAAPVLGSFTVFTALGKFFYIKFLLTFDDTETPSEGFKREGEKRPPDGWSK